MILDENGQKLAKFGDILIGGEPDQYPTTLIGSIFYSGHDIIINEKTGDFNRLKAEEELTSFLEYAEKTDLPAIVDVISSYSTSLIKWCEFIADYTDLPFLVDGGNHDVRLETMDHLYEIGLKERAIYNCIDAETDDNTLQKIGKLKVDKAIILCYKNVALTPKDKIELLEGSEYNKGLLEKVKEIGIDNYIVDTGVLDIPSIGIAAETIKLIKNKLKLPVGCAPINAISAWSKRSLFGQEGYAVSASALINYVRDAGADWIIYGSINKAYMAFPGIAATDNIASYVRKRINKKKSVTTDFFKKLR